MQVTVEAVNKIERKMTIIVPIEKMNDAFNKKINTLSKTVKVNGYRKGKIPLDYIRQRFGDTARQEALSEVIQSSLHNAITQEKLNPVSVPMVEPKKISPDHPLEFVATFEIVPEIEQLHFDTKEIEKETTVLSQADLQQVIDNLRNQHCNWKEVHRPAQLKDQVNIDFIGTIEGKKFKGGEAKNYSIVLGSKSMIPGFEDGIVNMKSGESKVIPVNFPEKYFAEEVAGKAAEFNIHLKTIKEADLPAVDTDFIKKVGVPSGKLEDLESEIRKNLEKEIERLIKLKLKEKVFNQLIEQNPFDVPKALIENEAKRIHDQLHPHHGDDHHHSEAEMASFNEAAKRQVILGLIVAEVIKKHQLVCDQSRVEQQIKDLSMVYEQPQQIIEWYSKNKKRRYEIEMQVLEDQVIEKLLEGVKIIEKPISYSTFIGQKVHA